MKITVCGLAGTGTSTFGKQLAGELQYAFFSSGDAFRQKAQECGLSLNEFEQLCQTDESYDKALDARVQQYGDENDDIVVESRLAWHFIPDSFKIKLWCADEVRIDRVAERDGLSREEARDKTVHREDAIRQRYADYYGITAFDADAHFDLVLDSTRELPGQLVSFTIEKLPRTQ